MISAAARTPAQEGISILERVPSRSMRGAAKGATANPAPPGLREANPRCMNRDSPDPTLPRTTRKRRPNVGESMSRRGEDIANKEGKEPGREETEPADSPTERPTVTSSGRDATGV